MVRASLKDPNDARRSSGFKQNGISLPENKNTAVTEYFYTLLSYFSFAVVDFNYK